MARGSITHLERRKVEAGILIPMVQAFQRAFGKERANAVARDVIADLARKDGERWASEFGSDLKALEQVSRVWGAGGALDVQHLEASQDRLEFDVTRCGYAELYKDLGLPELGYLFHCNRDFAMVEGFGRGVTLKRSQTLMEGADHCDFRFAAKRP